MKKDLLTIADLEKSDIDAVFSKAAILKELLRKGLPYKPLLGKTLGMIFDKSSTRTRLSFEVGMTQLGGTSIILNSRETQMGRGETVSDTAKILSLYLDGVMIRTYKHEMLEEFASNASIPVINGLTDSHHPCQILSDIFTIIAKKGTYENLKIAYLGDGNNIANSWINAAARLPFDLYLACPEGYEPDSNLMTKSVEMAPGNIILTNDPYFAAENADILYTDVWTSMGQESEKDTRNMIFRPFQLNASILKKAKGDALVMHCLPAHRGEEITSEVIDGRHSIVFDQAENRLHVQKAILDIMLNMGG